jgi:hypothetical protein
VDPFTIATIASAGINAIGKLMSGSSAAAIDRNQAAAYGTQALTAQSNTDLLNKQADIADLGVDFAGSKEKQALAKIADAGRQTLAAQRSYFAGSHLDPTFGSPLLAQAITAGRVATDMDLAKASFAVDKANALTTEANIRGQAVGQAGQALTSLYNQSSALMKGSADQMAGYFGAATALLSGASSLGNSGGFSMPKLDLSGVGFNPIAGAAGA